MRDGLLVVGVVVGILAASLMALREIGAWLRGESRLVRWWCRNVAGHRYEAGACLRCEDTLW
jgi:hypothetical protein